MLFLANLVYVVAFGGSIVGFVSGQRLDSYNVDKNEISVSGISAGGAMAVQFHVAYSGSVKGVGSVAGIPYHCAFGNILEALEVCMALPADIVIEDLEAYTNLQADNGLIDAVSNMAKQKVIVIHGINDTRVNVGASAKIADYYRQYGSKVKEVYRDGMEHNFPTEDYGSDCSVTTSPYIGKCRFNGAFAILNHIYGKLKRPVRNARGEFLTFNQREFVVSNEEDPSDDPMFMDTEGFAYIPSGCSKKGRHHRKNGKACKLHVVFHGCKQGRQSIGDVFAKHAGYNEVAEANNIIILYPQTALFPPYNPNGCYDWWGVTSIGYDLKSAPEMATVKRMIDRIIGQ
ncbi:hypothetical protein ScPMuIL_001011 [Solemya velum]